MKERVSGTYALLLQSFYRGLLAQNKSPQTIALYTDAAQLLFNFLREVGMPTEPHLIRREHVEAFIAALLERPKDPNRGTGTLSASTAATRYRGLQQWFKWMVEEGEIDRSPMEKMKPPKVEEEPPPVLTEGEFAKLLKVCEGKDFYNRRDTAMIRLLWDTGMRVSELVGMRVGDIDWEQTTVSVLGKGKKYRATVFGRKTAQALDRYSRSRSQYVAADRPEFWLGSKGPLTRSGVLQILRKRGDSVGIDHLHPHQLRHSFAHNWLDAGGTEGSLMMLAGWKSRTMLQKYGASVAAQRARDEHRRLDREDGV